MEYIKKLISEFSSIKQIKAIALGGSRASGLNDKDSDYDIYVYYNGEISSDIRKGILEKYCSYMEIGNEYWELEDDCVLNNGVVIEFIYRKMDEFEKNIQSVVINNNAYNGYTTCMWDNLMRCKVLYDSNGDLQKLKKKYDVPYPEALSEKIVKKNLELLHGYIPSFSEQLTKASKRGDIVSVNHRTTEFLASYFDLIFAFNKVMHPGEKRMIENCLKYCDTLPKNFEKNIKTLLYNLYDNQILTDTINKIVEEIKIWIKL